MLTESIDFFKNYDRLNNPAQDADMEAYVYSKELWDDIDLREHPSHQVPMACQCQNPFCENHGTEDEDLNQEWPSIQQRSSSPEKHATTSDPTGHSHKRHKLTVLEDKSPKAVKISGAPQNSTLLRNRRAGTRKDICQFLTDHSRKRQKLAVLEDKSPKAVVICGAPQNSTLLRNRRARTKRVSANRQRRRHLSAQMLIQGSQGPEVSLTEMASIPVSVPYSAYSQKSGDIVIVPVDLFVW